MAPRPCLVLLVATTAMVGPGAQEPDPAPAAVQLLAQRCVECHGAKKQRGKLRLDARELALAGGATGPALVPGQPEQSLLLQLVRGEEKKRPMPKGKERLAAREIETLRAWIAAGAPWPAGAGSRPAAAERHWAYVAPVATPPPAVRDAGWVENPIDRFVLARLEAEGLAPAPPADRATLLRRVTLDLIGLPPAPEDVDRFVAATAADAYEQEVDRLLASPRDGERMARPWLDLARYADTNGYEKDLPRSLWPWRDWVIQALNADMPFDRFTIEQLAGDLLPDATLAQRIATGFQRNTLLNDEGGIDAEEFRIVAVKDRVDTVATVWLGSTLGCAQCHDHKFDPFTQRDYYRMLAYWNSTEDSGKGNGPELQVPTAAQAQELRDLDTQLAAKEALLAAERRDGAQAQWEQQLLANLPPRLPGEVPFVDASEVERDRPFAYGALLRREGDGCVLSRIDDQHGYRGVDLFVNGGRLEMHVVHAWPGNGIKVTTRDPLPHEGWHHVFATYDGSSKAAGITLYVDGAPQPLQVEKDQLTATIRTSCSWRLGSRSTTGKLAGEVREALLFDRLLTADEVGILAASRLGPALAKDAAARTADEAKEIRASYVLATPALAAERAAAARLRERRQSLPIATTMVLRERSESRPTHLQRRGDFRQPGDAVHPGLPGVLAAPGAAMPKDRLELARWLVSAHNPLGARVLVNRAFELFFGQGLVRTLDDFGTQGEPASHPELLEWLAAEFGRNGQSQKALHRLLVTSATYRQSAVVTAALRERDPQNTLLARAPRLRLEAEQVRDNALALAGLLDDRIGGPSVMPWQPPGTWADSFANYDTPDLKWVEAKGRDRFRRGIYTYLRRSALYPASLLFDAARREVCTVRRSRTNTPLQALVTLNDPVYRDAALGLGRRLLRAADTPAARLERGMRLCVARAPSAAELAELGALHARARAEFAADPAAARRLVQDPEIDTTGLDPIELAALVVVANVLLNLDETVTRG